MIRPDSGVEPRPAPSDVEAGAAPKVLMDADALLAAGDFELSEENDLSRIASEALGGAASSGCAPLVAALLVG